MTDLNITIIKGTVASPPERRVLPSDTILVQLQVTTRLGSETLSLPVTAWDPDEKVEQLAPGDEVLVLGRVRRRFFRAGGATASRVEVEADKIIPASQTKRCAKAIANAVASVIA